MDRRDSRRNRVGTHFGVVVAIAVAILGISRSAMGQGILLPSIGPANQSMGGASVASPIDGAGAIYWNPATTSGLVGSEVTLGLGLLLPTTQLDSSINAGALGPGVPAANTSGSTRGEPGAAAVPTMSIVHRSEESAWTFGLGVFGVGGFVSNYPASLTNPISTPQAPNGFGLGRIRAQAAIYEIIPTASYAVTEKLSVGISPVVSLAQISADPFFLAAPNDANGDGFFSYGPGSSTRGIWGRRLSTRSVEEPQKAIRLSAERARGCRRIDPEG